MVRKAHDRQLLKLQCKLLFIGPLKHTTTNVTETQLHQSTFNTGVSSHKPTRSVITVTCQTIIKHSMKLWPFSLTSFQMKENRQHFMLHNEIALMCIFSRPRSFSTICKLLKATVNFFVFKFRHFWQNYYFNDIKTNNNKLLFSIFTICC